MRYLGKFNEAIDDGLVTTFFNYVRNFLYASIFLAAGTYSIQNSNSALFGLIVAENLGYGIMGLGVLLLMLSLYEGIYRLSRFRFSTAWSILLTIVYVLASVRIVEAFWEFRIAP